MVGHHQAYNIGAVFFDGVRVCLDGHIRGYWGDARGHDAAAIIIFHQAEATRSSGHQVWMMTKGGNFDAVFRGCI
jgi:hypothetical protein